MLVLVCVKFELNIARFLRAALYTRTLSLPLFCRVQRDPSLSGWTAFVETLSVSISDWPFMRMFISVFRSD